MNLIPSSLPWESVPSMNVGRGLQKREFLRNEAKGGGMRGVPAPFAVGLHLFRACGGQRVCI